jgi:hypothetical protein
MAMAGLLGRRRSDQRTYIVWRFQARLSLRIELKNFGCGSPPDAMVFNSIHSFAQVSCENRREFY